MSDSIAKLRAEVMTKLNAHIASESLTANGEGKAVRRIIMSHHVPGGCDLVRAMELPDLYCSVRTWCSSAGWCATADPNLLEERCRTKKMWEQVKGRAGKSRRRV